MVKIDYSIRFYFLTHANYSRVVSISIVVIPAQATVNRILGFGYCETPSMETGAN